MILRIARSLFALLGFIYILMAIWCHFGPQEMFNDYLSREEFFSYLALGFIFLATWADILEGFTNE